MDLVIRCKGNVLDFVDAHEVFERIGNSNEDTLNKLLSDFYLDYNGMDEKVIDLLSKNRYEEALNIVYLVKGAAGNLSMKKLYSDSINLELAIKTYVDGNIFIALPHFVDTLKSILAGFEVVASGGDENGEYLGRELIVIIDKDRLSGDILSQIINSEDNETLVFNNALEGLNEITKIIESGGKIKVIIMEIALPVIDGLTLVKYIRKLNTTYRIPIIISSAISDGFVIKEVRKADIDGYVLKPYNRDLILGKLRKYTRN
ncbi:MAG: response regulator [Clostridium sp.]|uniref:response regulator n=1 Tax=Clostridium sp. TaxID=1506 RepID=UPI002FC841DA